MKFKKLLVLSALMFSGISSVWAVDANVWQKPAVPEGMAMELGAECYFYNVGSGLFFTQGNAWGTQASVGATGLKVKIESTADEGVYTLTDYVATQSAWKKWWFVNNAEDPTMYVDFNNQENFLWSITEMGGNVYRFSPSASNPFAFGEGVYVGLNRVTDATSTLLKWNCTPEDGSFIDWQLIAIEAGDSYFSSVEVYNAAMALKETLDKAEQIGAKVDEQIAVYNNTSSTKDELIAANTKAKEIVAAREKELEKEDLKNATAANPKSATSFITNPDFVSGPSTGWTAGEGSDNFGAYNGKENAELYNKSKFNVYQKLEGLPNGVYALGVNAFYRAGGTAESYRHYVAKDEQSRYAKLYAFNGIDSLMSTIDSPYKGAPTEQPATGGWAQDDAKQYFIPNDMVAAEHAMHVLGLYASKVFNSVEDGTLTIGVLKNQHIETDWAIFDDFSLTYYGAGEDAYQAWSDAAMGQYNTEAPAEGVLFTQSYIDALKAAVTDKKAATKEEVVANIAAADAAQNDYNENLSLWQQWSDQVDKAAESYRLNKDAEIDVEIKFALLDYIEDDGDVLCTASKIKQERALDNEGLKKEMANLKTIVDNFETAVKNIVKPGDDVTRFLENPAFDVAAGAETGWTGWHNTTNSMPTTGGTDDNKTAEAWSAKSFDLYQTIENAPVGIYEIGVQGFYRYGRDDNAWNIYQAQEIEYVKPKQAPVYVYLNDKKTPFKNIYDEPSQTQDFYVAMANTNEDGTPKVGGNGIYQWKDIPYSVQNIPADNPEYFYPNGMASAAVAFSAGLYTQTATSLVAKQGDVLRLGVKGSTQQPGMTDCWVIWDNFKLVYKGKEKKDVKPVLAEALEDAKNLLKDPETGEDKPIGKDAYERLTKVLDEAQKAYDEDSDDMWDKLIALVEVDVEKSAELFKSLKAAYMQFEQAINDAEAASDSEKPSLETISSAWELHDAIMNGMDARTLTDEDAERMMKEMEEQTRLLKIPAAMDEASDDKPANATYMVKNPTYADNAADGWSGTAATVNYHEAEMYNKNFDYYQDIEGVKPGTYEVSLQGYYRAGSSVEDYKTFNETPEANNNAYLYAVTANGTSSKSLLRLATGATKLDQGAPVPSGYASAYVDSMFIPNGEKMDTILTHTVVCNNMEQAEIIFSQAENNYSGRSLIVKVGDDGKLRIGVKKEVALSNDWTIWTNWKLMYYGPNSSKEVTGDEAATGISAASSEKVVKTVFYRLNGARVSKPSKGLAIMKQTMSDGSVTVKKVIVK